MVGLAACCTLFEPEMPETPEPGEGIRREFPFFSSADPDPAAASTPAPNNPASFFPVPAYLDSAATAQKPAAVINRLSQFLSRECANIHRGAYRLSADATNAYEEARQKVAAFIGAGDARGVIFTRGATESINLVSHSIEEFLPEGATILTTTLEHHSNIVPWQLLAARRKLRIEFVDVTENGEISRSDLLMKLKQLRPKLLALTQVSNALGTITPTAEYVAAAREHGAMVLVDGAQSVVHQPSAFDALGADFFAFSGHKLYGPMGIGVLAVRSAMLPRMKPFLGGGGMIQSVTCSGSSWADPPHCFEAGTPPVAEAIGLGAAVDFLSAIGMERIERHERRLFEYAFSRLSAESGVTIYGPRLSGGAQAGILSFNVNGVHPHDLSTVADTLNVQIRAGHHCAMPLLEKLGIHFSARLSLGVYSIEDDIDRLVEAIRKARKTFR